MYIFCTLHIVHYNYSIENWVWLGLVLWWLMVVDAWCSLASSLHRSWTPPRLHLPEQGGLNAATASLLSGGRSHSTTSHPTVLASQVAWITGDSQFFWLKRANSPGLPCMLTMQNTQIGTFIRKLNISILISFFFLNMKTCLLSWRAWLL